MATDLDELEAFYSRIDFDRSPQVVAAIRELRAAREVVEEANSLRAFMPLSVDQALERYEEVVSDG